MLDVDKITYTDQENILFSICEKEATDGYTVGLTVDRVVSFLRRSTQQDTVLGTIWGFISDTVKDNIVPHNSFFYSLRLVGIYQNGYTMNEYHTLINYPLPVFEGITTEPFSSSMLQRYRTLFDSINKPNYDILDGQTGRDYFMKSGLPLNELSVIWRTSDLTQDGNLNFPEFCIAFDMIEKRKLGEDIPTDLSPLILEWASSYEQPSELKTREVESHHLSSFGNVNTSNISPNIQGSVPVQSTVPTFFGDVKLSTSQTINKQDVLLEQLRTSISDTLKRKESLISDILSLSHNCYNLANSVALEAKDLSVHQSVNQEIDILIHRKNNELNHLSTSLLKKKRDKTLLMEKVSKLEHETLEWNDGEHINNLKIESITNSLNVNFKSLEKQREYLSLLTSQVDRITSLRSSKLEKSGSNEKLNITVPNVIFDDTLLTNQFSSITNTVSNLSPKDEQVEDYIVQHNSNEDDYYTQLNNKGTGNSSFFFDSESVFGKIHLLPAAHDWGSKLDYPNIPKGPTIGGYETTGNNPYALSTETEQKILLEETPTQANPFNVMNQNTTGNELFTEATAQGNNPFGQGNDLFSPFGQPKTDEFLYNGESSSGVGSVGDPFAHSVSQPGKEENTKNNPFSSEETAEPTAPDSTSEKNPFASFQPTESIPGKNPFGSSEPTETEPQQNIGENDASGEERGRDGIQKNPFAEHGVQISTESKEITKNPFGSVDTFEEGTPDKNHFASFQPTESIPGKNPFGSSEPTETEPHSVIAEPKNSEKEPFNLINAEQNPFTLIEPTEHKAIPGNDQLNILSKKSTENNPFGSDPFYGASVNDNDPFKPVSMSAIESKLGINDPFLNFMDIDLQKPTSFNQTSNSSTDPFQLTHPKSDEEDE